MSELKARIEALPPLREVIANSELQASKALGQNFLLDQNITDKIVRHAGDISDHVIFEIGPGPGGLTRSILKAEPAKLVAIEFDPRAIFALSSLKEAAGERLELIEADATKIDLRHLNPEGRPAKIIANLPYNVATPLLIGWLKQIDQDVNVYDQMLLMFQKEVTQRICAKENDNNYGRLAVLSQWLCHCKMAFDLPPGAFTPPPKVKSAIADLKPRHDKANIDFKALESITAAAFGKRRKMIRQSLKPYMAELEALGLDPTLRAENLSVDQFIALVTQRS